MPEGVALNLGPLWVHNRGFSIQARCCAVRRGHTAERPCLHVSSGAPFVNYSLNVSRIFQKTIDVAPLIPGSGGVKQRTRGAERRFPCRVARKTPGRPVPARSADIPHAVTRFSHGSRRTPCRRFPDPLNEYRSASCMKKWALKTVVSWQRLAKA